MVPPPPTFMCLMSTGEGAFVGVTEPANRGEPGVGVRCPVEDGLECIRCECEFKLLPPIPELLLECPPPPITDAIDVTVSWLLCCCPLVPPLRLLW